MALFGPPNVEKMKARRDVNGLIKALGYMGKGQVFTQEVARIRCAAATALGEIGDPIAINPLIREIGVGGGVGEAAAKALVKIGIASVAPLVNLIQDRHENEHKRLIAAECLGRITDFDIDVFLELLKQNDTRQIALQALETSEWPQGLDEKAAWYWAAKGDLDKCVAIGQAAVQPLIACYHWQKLTDKDGQRRVVLALAKIGSPAAIKVLRHYGEIHGDPERRQAIELIRIIGGPEAIEALLYFLDRFNSIYAADALEKLDWAPGQDRASARYFILQGKERQIVERGASLIDPLISLLGDRDIKIRQASARALVAIYRQPDLAEELKQNILAQRGKIIAQHLDGHDKCDNHKDRGIGVDFPL